jgi:hypothetical protein
MNWHEGEGAEESGAACIIKMYFWVMFACLPQLRCTASGGGAGMLVGGA